MNAILKIGGRMKGEERKPRVERRMVVRKQKKTRNNGKTNTGWAARAGREKSRAQRGEYSSYPSSTRP